MQSKKIAQLEAASRKEVESDQSNGFDAYKFEYNALPELNFEEIDTSLELFGKMLSIPVFCSSMTGGIDQARDVNFKLAKFAQDYSIGMCVGSQKVSLIDETLNDGFNVRDVAPDILLFANLGAVQLNYGFDTAHYLNAVERIKADALVLHLNPLQEVFQNTGDINFSGLLPKIEKLCKETNIPVIVKDIGFGISRNVAEKLIAAGVNIIDVAGAGGTDWIKLESIISNNTILQRVAQTFSKVGTPTANALEQLGPIRKFASGGIITGVDVAKAVAMGADLVGIARGFLLHINTLDEYYLVLLKGIQISMFAAGIKNISELKNTNKLFKLT